MVPHSSPATLAPTRYVESRGRRLAYRRIGVGQPIILCNRFRGVMDSWDPAFLDALARQFTVITFDYSGLGLSGGEPTYHHATLARDVKDLADALLLSRFAVCGWSLGGIAAQIVATEYPERVTHGVFMATTPPGKMSWPAEQLFYERALKPENNFDDEIVLFFEPTSEASCLAAARSHARITARKEDVSPAIPQPLALKMLGDNQGEGIFPDVLGTLEKLRHSRLPMLAICADHDIVFPVENWFVLNRQLPTVQIMVFPQTGHGPHHQLPEEIAAHISTFLLAAH